MFLWDVPTPNERWTNWQLDHFEVFDVVIPKPGALWFDDDARAINRFSLELLLFGTGKSAHLPPPKFRDYLSKVGVQIDVMDTVSGGSMHRLRALTCQQRNACSTYNLLAEEGRRVAAALLPIQPRVWERK